jgi:hypothetical protein
MAIKRVSPSLINTTNAADGSVLLYNAANGVVEFGTALDNNVWVNSNDYNTYTTVLGLVNTVQANLTSIISAAPATLDTLAEIAAALENDANLAVTLATQISNVASSISSLPDSAANDYATYTTVTSLINNVAANVNALPDSAANDFNTYSTVVGLINTINDIIESESSSAAANDYATYTTITGLLSTVESNVTSLTSTVDSVQANVYNTYYNISNSLNLIQDNVSSIFINTLGATSQLITTTTSNTFSLASSISDANNIIVTFEGLMQYPNIDYVVNGSTLIINNTAPIHAGLTLEVRTLPDGAIYNQTQSNWLEVSSSTTIPLNKKVIVDTSSSAVTLTLPLNPAFGNEIRIIDGTGNASTNPIIIYGNGSNIQASTDNVAIDVNRAAFTLVYYNSYNGWLFGEK